MFNSTKSTIIKSVQQGNSIHFFVVQLNFGPVYTSDVRNTHYITLKGSVTIFFGIFISLFEPT